MPAQDLTPLFPRRRRPGLWQRIARRLDRGRQMRRLEALRRTPHLARDIGLRPTEPATQSQNQAERDRRERW
ncbi:hypothetical protein ACOXXX_12940 [Thalassococcus sp. BH17M4-6]|uniref:hypothetical protein n=1 Tax=Thalassococcus sp. BH17M4-6 TaxID=3413148 RepID=UPI003BE929E6